MFDQPKRVVTPFVKTPHGQLIAEDVDASLKAFGGNRFEMILVASHRVRELNRGATPLVLSKSKPGVTALLEIAAGKVGKDYKFEYK
jgi:DNA-directed RNA polymerase omega subunit